jgi:hypothetical protein
MCTLRTTVAIFAGHGKPRDRQPVAWIGTVGEYLQVTATAVAGDDLQAMLDDLEERGFHLIGGGAKAAFIMLRIEPVEPAYSRLMGTPAQPMLR